ncbi:MAG: glycosyltransferase [Bacteroidota bacterium]
MYSNVALLVTHFNRSKSLERQFKTFKDLNIEFGEIIVSDDASEEEHIKVLEELKQDYDFKLVKAKQNGGLGNNLNKGQDNVTLPYTLYVQEDFIPQEAFKPAFENALVFMNSDEELDLVRFHSFGKYPYLKPYKSGFSMMDFSLFKKGYRKFYKYNDHPHLRRSNFFQKFGRYAEDCNPEQSEYRMVMSFLKNKGKSLFYDEHKSLFHHGNTNEEPSTMLNDRTNWKRSDNSVIAFLRNIYRNLKFNYDYFFLKP